MQRLTTQMVQFYYTIFYSSKCTARSRSASADGLLDSCILDENDLNHNVGSCDSILEHDDLLKCATKLDSPRSPKAGPRICKPEEKFQQQPETDVRAIRGRRKPLYSTPTNRSTMPPQIPPKPAIGMTSEIYSRPIFIPQFSRSSYGFQSSKNIIN